MYIDTIKFHNEFKTVFQFGEKVEALQDVSKKQKNKLYRTSVTSTNPDSLNSDNHLTEISSKERTSSFLDFGSKETGSIFMIDLEESLSLLVIVDPDINIQDLISEYNIKVFYNYYTKVIANIDI